jgi:hypothetical protein
MDNEAFVRELVSSGSLHNPRLVEALRVFKRGMFTLGQTLSIEHPVQIRLPSVSFMLSAINVQIPALEALNIQPGERFLDIGCGTGFVTLVSVILMCNSLTEGSARRTHGRSSRIYAGNRRRTRNHRVRTRTRTCFCER